MAGDLQRKASLAAYPALWWLDHQSPHCIKLEIPHNPRGGMWEIQKLRCHVMKSIFQISKSLGIFQPHCAASFNPTHPPFQTLPKHLAAQSSPESFRPRNAGNKWTRRPSWGTNDGEN